MSMRHVLVTLLLVVLSSIVAVVGLCPYSCANGGVCNVNTNTCTCAIGFVGVDCTRRGCLSNCNHVGYCDLSSNPPSCLCQTGWAGLDCELSVNNVKTNSTTAANSNAASSNSSSIQVDRKQCTPACDVNHGVCWQGACACENGYTGRRCAHKLCKDNCNGKGVCDKTTGLCECYHPYTGATCAGQSKAVVPRELDTLADVHGPTHVPKHKRMNTKKEKERTIECISFD